MLQSSEQKNIAHLLEENKKLRARIAELEKLKKHETTVMKRKHSFSPERLCKKQRAQDNGNVTATKKNESNISRDSIHCELNCEQIKRYGRHLILPSIGIKGQQSICNSSVLVVGAGGLGSPVCLYLAAAGVGRLGIIDPDVIECGNLHRQIIHTEARIGSSKAISAREQCKRINKSIKIHAYCESLNHMNAIDMCRSYDIVCDCTDNVATRYLLNDACVVTGTPLIAGSCVKVEGQVSVYNYNDGPCLRCWFPNPLPANAQNSCANDGVLGVVPGIIGTLQAFEVLKVLIKVQNNANLPHVPDTHHNLLPLSGKLLIFDGHFSTFHIIKKSKKRKNCVVCGNKATINSDTIRNNIGSLYTRQCSIETAMKEAMNDTKYMQISVGDYALLLKHSYNEHFLNTKFPNHLLLDVRGRSQFEICSLPNAINIPYSQLDSQLHKLAQHVSNIRRINKEMKVKSSKKVALVKNLPTTTTTTTTTTITTITITTTTAATSTATSTKTTTTAETTATVETTTTTTTTITTTIMDKFDIVDIYCMCRRGIASMKAVRKLSDMLNNQNKHNCSYSKSSSIEIDDKHLGPVRLINIQGGLTHWSRKVNPNFPLY